MKLSQQPSRIVGLRVGKVVINLLYPGATSVITKFILLRDPSFGDNINVGQFTKTQWSPAVIEAFEKFVEALEDDAVRDLFGQDATTTDASPVQDSGLKFPPVPILGGTKST